MNEAVKVSKHHEIIGVINNEIARLRGNIGIEITPSLRKIKKSEYVTTSELQTEKSCSKGLKSI